MPRKIARLINRLRVFSHMLRSRRKDGIEAYYCDCYAKLLSDGMSHKAEVVANAKRALRDAQTQLQKLTPSHRHAA